MRICFDSRAPLELLLRLIRSAEPSRSDDVAARACEFSEGNSYCLLDARIDDDIRCATIFQIHPKYQLILGGVYPARKLAASNGQAYLEFLRNPKLATDAAPSVAASDSNHRGIEAGLSVLLLSDGTVLRSATLDDLTHLTSEQNYVRLHLASGECTLVRGPLQKYQDALPDYFIRASRRIIINVRNVQRLRRVSRNLSVIYFAGTEQPVRLGRKASTTLRTALTSQSRLTVNRTGKAARAS
ncbi:MAG: LytTR family DNA-binding domain-containing protein [Pseudomonadota bacterium]|nr:LytTR family DNA-binding domain-containing protein [Pseudomonadota bacterium]